MAKRKRRKSNSSNKDYSALIGIVLILISVLGVGHYGLVGRLIASFSVFLTGVGYNIFLIFLLIIGGYIIIKREYPKVVSSKAIGLYLLTIGLLTLCHFKYITNYKDASLIFEHTLDNLMTCFNNIMSSGIVNIDGGGLIGCAFGSLFKILFAEEGTRIVVVRYYSQVFLY